MARACTVCTHRNRAEVDAAIVAGESSRKVGARFDLHQTSIIRHKQRHLSPAIAAVHRRRQAEGEAVTLLDRVEDLYSNAVRILDASEVEGRPSVSLSAIRELRGIVELLSKLTGELDDRPQTTINLLVSSEWREVEAALWRALAAHPEARAAVAGELAALQP